MSQVPDYSSSQEQTALGDQDGLRGINFRTEYRTGEADLIAEFYEPCLRTSMLYDRAAGFFRSTVLLLIGPALIEFAKRGGTARIIFSPKNLTDDDVDAIVAGYQKRETILSNSLGEEIETLLVEAQSKHQTEALATLISVGALDMRIAVRPKNSSIFHEKLGIFTDAFGNSVSFRGSSNESWSGWHADGNQESFDAFCSWTEGSDPERVLLNKQYFERLWNGGVKDVYMYEVPDAVKKRLHKISAGSLEEIELVVPETKPAGRTPFPHQSNALESWYANGRRGVLQHATGSGKTFTALLAIKEYIRSGGTALILVPSRLLLNQWADEIGEELPDADLLLVGAGNNQWRKPNRLRSFTDPDPELGSRITVATMQTASGDEFRQKIRDGDHLLLIADEVHRIGSNKNSKALEIGSGARLGLSATPERFGDPEGTQKILSYFGPILSPIFTLSDAIKAGRLVPYEYYPHLVNLTAEEAEDWRDLSDKIAKSLARSPEDASGNRLMSEQTRMLLIKRARIAKKASAKAPLAKKVIQEHYKKGQSWLIYCEDTQQLRTILEDLEGAGFDAMEYHTQMNADPEAVLTWFRRYGGILVSIGCLDEGVDIPTVSHALILASSQNPRQFIQRRGRVLRTAHNKELAYVHDALVMPVHVDDEPTQSALLKSELARAIEFAQSAFNKSAEATLRDIAAQCGVDPDEMVGVGVEDDDDDTE